MSLLLSKTVSSSLVLLLLTGTLVGCGPDRNELMMQHAQRVRDVDDEDETDDSGDQDANVAANEQVATSATSDPAGRDGRDPSTDETVGTALSDNSILPDQIESGGVVKNDETATKTDTGDLLQVEPIEQRRPEKPLTKEEKRKWVAENLKTIADALFAYHRDHDRLPPNYRVVNGFRTVSWRVELLPYLGYEELYSRFDTKTPWNKPPNDELLKFMPPEFASPERFDNKTNIVMPSGEGMIGGSRLNESIIEDGIANTILLLELDDGHAVPWTSPEDLASKDRDEIKAALSGPREDGTFGVWANGWTVLLSHDLSAKFLRDALTIDAGDGLQAGRIHQDIPLGEVSEAAVANKSDEQPETAEQPETVAMRPMNSPPPQAATLAVRSEVPNAATLAEVQSRFRDIYQERIGEADKDEDKVKLAGEMLDQSASMEEDPAGAYALQTAAMRLAIDAGDVRELIRAIDQHVAQFEVDAYKINRDWLLEFARTATDREPSEIDGMQFLERAIRVIYAGIHGDDYVDVATLTRYAGRLLDQKRDEELPKMLTKLRGLLGAAKRDYDAAGDSLSAYRRNPDDAEAAADIGRFLCFIKGDWQQGLPLLTKGGPEALQEVARRDLQGADNYVDFVALGDAWWNLSEKARTHVYRQSARDRAVMWYEQAYPIMPDSLDRLHVKNRLDEAADTSASSPLALTERLAEEAGVDLRVSLAAAASGQQGRRLDDDDDD